MKSAIIKEHRDFFQKNGLIEFEDFLTEDQVQAFNESINQAIGQRTNLPAERWRHLSSDQLFLQGRDLWRHNDELRKLTCQPRFAQIAAELIEQKPLRLGYTQLLSVRQTEASSQPTVSAQFFQQQASLNEVSCLSEVACGLLLCLSASDEEKESKGLDIFPKMPGHAVFFQPTLNLPWDAIYQHIGQRFYLITYTYLVSHYQLQPKDPHTHVLKHLGYVFNDKLLDRLNPVVFR